MPPALRGIISPVRFGENERVMIADPSDPIGFKSIEADEARHDEWLAVRAEGPTWYEWSLAHWGTKWDTSAEGVEVETDGESLVYRFSTAWSPPQPVIAVLREHFPDAAIIAFFDEPGMEEAGYY
jgi:hypothetical protein